MDTEVELELVFDDRVVIGRPFATLFRAFWKTLA